MTSGSTGPSASLYLFVTRFPLPFLIIIPAIFIAFTAVGWSQDELVEERVGRMWIPTRTDYHDDKKYAEDLRGDDTAGRDGTTVFAAMAVSRDGGNLFKESRLNEILERMNELEQTTVEYNGNTYTWQDLCSSNSAGLSTTYKFVCARLSPTDYFLESRKTSFREIDRVTWRANSIHGALLTSRLPRVGTMTSSCTSSSPTSSSNACDHNYQLRTNPAYVIQNEYPLSTLNPVALVADVGNLEMNDFCRICIESAYDQTIDALTAGATGLFGVLQLLLNGIATSNSANAGEAGALLQSVAGAAKLINRESVAEFYYYFVARGLYGQLGATAYVENYQQIMNSPFASFCDVLIGGTCPRTITLAEASAILSSHADAAFSSVNTGGLPFPFWNPDTDILLDLSQNKTLEDLSPFGGSGLDMSGGTPMQSSIYFDLANFGTPDHNPLYGESFNPFANQADPFWSIVAMDPIYVWFMAAVEPMTSHCGNDAVPATKSGNPNIDIPAGAFLASISPSFCTTYNVPFEDDATLTRQHFAKMWYDLVIDSPPFLGITQGVDDPYTWTTGQGCGYDVRGSRFSYTNQTESAILAAASGELYYIDEGVSLGVIDKNLLIGDAEPPVGEYNAENPLRKVGAIQILYPTLIPADIVKRVKNCNRPEGPLDILEEDAKEVLLKFKEAFENTWSEGWDNDDAGDVQFVGFYDDVGVIGTTGRMLEEITLDGGTLMAISIIIIAIFSAIFLASCDLIESRVLVTIIGVALVILSFFAALGVSILAGIKINITIGWTLPFIIIGLGVDDMYIVSLALKNRGGFEVEDFVETMKEVIVPISMTSLVNLCMFAVMNISDIPSVYKTARAAMFCIVFLYIAVLLCFPAYCWIDMKRQRAGRADILFCKKAQTEAHPETSAQTKHTSPAGGAGIIYDRFYKPLMIQPGMLRTATHVFVFLAALALLAVAIFGYTETEVGLGLEDFFPTDNQAGKWASHRTEHLATWSITMNWGRVDYTDPQQQQKVIRQYEEVAQTPHVSAPDTRFLWIADLLIWSSRHCTEDFSKLNATKVECGREQIYSETENENEETCAGTWVKNTLGLRNKVAGDIYDEKCVPRQEGICRMTSQMHPFDLQELAAAGVYDPAKDMEASWCPVLQGFSEDRLKFCVERWREHTGGRGSLLLEENTATENPDCSNEFFTDDSIVSPIAIASGPTMYGIRLFSHEDTLDMIDETRAFCDDDETTHCFMSGIPYDYWEQYTKVDDLLYQIVGGSVAIGFVVSFAFLFGKLTCEHDHPASQVLGGSLIGAFLIAITCILSTMTVIGLSSLANVTLTAFSDMAFVLSIGFVVEYAVHVIHRFITAPLELETARERVEYSMEFLFLPTFMSFVSSTIGVVCLAFTDFKFNEVYFFRPLIIVMFITYFYGCFFLPVVLSVLNLKVLMLGHSETGAVGVVEKEEPENAPEPEKSKADNFDAES